MEGGRESEFILPPFEHDIVLQATRTGNRHDARAFYAALVHRDAVGAIPPGYFDAVGRTKSGDRVWNRAPSRYPGGRDYISTETKLPLYRLVLSREDGSDFEIASAQAGSVATRRTDDGASLTFEHPDHKLTIPCTVRIEPASSRLAWKIAIRNTGPLGVRSVFYPQWAAPLHLPKGESRLLFPFLDGQEFIEPGKYLPEGGGKRMQYPGQAALQMLAYHDAESGLLGMTLDGDGWVKHLRVMRIHGALDLSFEHNPDERPGTNIDLPYETVFQPFRGDWHDAADIYRDWAVKQKWARQKLTERNPPQYLTKAFPIVTFEIRGDPYSAEWSMYFPPSNRLINPEYHPSRIPALMQKYSAFFGSPVISQPFAWEHVAPGSQENTFRWWAVMRCGPGPRQPCGVQAIRCSSMLSGFRWGVNMDNVGYDERERFLKETAPKAAAYDSKGQPMEEQPPWANSIQLCIGTPFSQKHVLDSFVGCVQRGASLVQHDQDHGGAASVCYRRDHAHPPGYGRWMVDDTERVFAQMHSASKQIDPELRVPDQGAL